MNFNNHKIKQEMSKKNKLSSSNKWWKNYKKKMKISKINYKLKMKFFKD